MAQQLNVADLSISSPAFEPHGPMPARHTTEGEDVAPALEWTGAPEGTRSFAVVMHDPDAPLVEGFTHWVAYGIPGDATGLPEGGGDGLVEGVGSSGSQGYGGPAPPPGHGRHHYYFWVYALDEDVGLEPGLGRRDLLDRIEDHVIEQARVIGTYER